MKNKLYKYCAVLFVLVALGACTSGGFDENPQLDELNEAMKFAPDITLFANGQEVVRNSISVYEIEAKIGDAIDIEAQFGSGQDAVLEELIFQQTFFGTEIELDNTIFPLTEEADAASDYTFGPVIIGADDEWMPEDDIIPLNGGKSETFTYTYVVPDITYYGYWDVHAGDNITLHFRVRNSLDNFGYRPITIHVVE